MFDTKIMVDKSWLLKQHNNGYIKMVMHTMIKNNMVVNHGDVHINCNKMVSRKQFMVIICCMILCFNMVLSECWKQRLQTLSLYMVR